MPKSNTVLITLVCFVIFGCPASVGSDAKQEQRSTASMDVYYRDFDTTSIVDIDVEALKHANDLSYSLAGESAETLDVKLHSLNCQIDRDQVAQDLRLLVIYRAKNMAEEWRFSKFFFVTPDGTRCQLNDVQRKLLDGWIRSSYSTREERRS